MSLRRFLLPRDRLGLVVEKLPAEWLNRGSLITEDQDFVYSIDEIVAFRDILFVSGSAQHRQKRIVAVFVTFHNSVQRVLVTGTPAEPLRFNLRLTLPMDQLDSYDAPNFELYARANIRVGFEFRDGSRFLVNAPYLQSWAGDPSHAVFQRFQEMVRQIGSGRILEIGSRARSSVVYRTFVPDGMTYVGMDILAGPNVDVVGDAHELSKNFAPETFDAAFSIAVFEHLLMPWKVAIELNKVLKPGSPIFIHSHQTFPMHDAPWDFWRFSDKAWHGLFNKFTGFEVLEAQMGERAYVVGSFLNDLTFKMETTSAFLGSTVICRKIGPSEEQWRADLPSVLDSIYPV